MRKIDDIDDVLLRALSTDGRQTVRALAREVSLSEPSVRDRISRLERDGIITGYHAAIDPGAIGGDTAAFVAIRTAALDKSVIKDALRADPCVLELHEVAGEDCLMLKVRAASTAALAEALDRFRAIPTVSDTRTTIVLRTVFERSMAPAPPPAEEPEG